MLQDHPIPQLLGWDKIVISSFGSGRPFWSLAVEWWIYVGVACCCFCYYDMKHHGIGVGKVIICGICSFVSIYNLVGGRGNGLTFIWILGAVAYKATKKIKVGNKQILRLSAALLGGIIIYGTRVKEEYDILFSSMIVVLLYIILAWGEGEQASKCKNSKLLKNISGYTYSLYLVHYGILKMMVNLQWEVPLGRRLILGVVLSNVIAIFFAYLVEK